MRAFAVLVPLILLTGCSSSVKQLNLANPQANDFPSSLASEYQAYADSENEQGRSWRAGHFADKGLDALAGKPVEPDPVDDSLPDPQRQELSDARGQLSKLLTDDVKAIAPQQLARAQLLFDCWQNEVAKNLNQSLVPCAEEFKSTLQQVQEAADPLVYGKTIRYSIDFAPGTKTLTDESLKTIQEAAAKVQNMQNFRVQIDAYIGRKTSQRKLSEARIVSVKKALVKAGISSRVIHVKKEGSAKAVILKRDRMATDTKKITITIKSAKAKTAKKTKNT